MLNWLCNEIVFRSKCQVSSNCFEIDFVSIENKIPFVDFAWIERTIREILWMVCLEFGNQCEIFPKFKLAISDWCYESDNYFSLMYCCGYLD